MGKIQALALLAVATGLVTADHITTPFDTTFEQVGKEQAVNSNLLRALARVESNFNPTVVSAPNRNGTVDIGLMQINERTAPDFGATREDLFSPYRNCTVAGKLLQRLNTIENGDTLRVISAYNVGPGNVRKGAKSFINAGYVSQVYLHFVLYSMGRVFYHG